MIPDRDIKKIFKEKASREPDKYYATGVLAAEGFKRARCGNCSRFFWSTTESKVCGDPACSGGFRFFDSPPAKKRLTYIEIWQEFARHFRKLGYTPIERYPVVARWREDTDFVQASIYDFQPYVVSGEVEPPANPLVVPQFCLRFNDIDNVGITGSHNTGFVMIGQHAFVPPKDYDQPKYFRDIQSWLKEGIGLPNHEITFHEDAWAGGGNFGPCMEFFSRGLELGNQVYMSYEQTPGPVGYKELSLKVLDMGMGQERNAWFTQAKSTSYETTFPTVCEFLYKRTGITPNRDILRKFLPYSSYLNIDEVESIDKTWQFVAGKVGTDVQALKNEVLPLAAIYSIADHSRSLLFALNDGALPSNVGGGYNLRVILRRALSFIDQYNWDIDLPELCKMHAAYLKPIFPEVSKNLNEVTQILEVERKKYIATREKTGQIVSSLLKHGEISNEKLVQLYDSQGISPETIRIAAKKLGKKVEVPEDFYKKVGELHEKSMQATATYKEEKLPLDDAPDTRALYFDDYKLLNFQGKVVKVIGKHVILDQTAFYPTSGGQIHDLGKIDGHEVTEVFKQGSIIVHQMENEHHGLEEGMIVHGSIDRERRMQLAHHHTSTHIVNAAARRVLGNHINQASAKKTLEKATLDITHYESIDDATLKKIEDEANRIVMADIKVDKSFMPRNEAEKKYGVNIYQGGVVPGKSLRIVNIEGVDVEACGGTHLDHTNEVGEIKILKSTKIQDGIVRLTFTAGKAAQHAKGRSGDTIEEAAKLLGCNENQVPGRAEELFSKWKEIVKKGKQVGFDLTSTEEFGGDVLARAASLALVGLYLYHLKLYNNLK